MKEEREAEEIRIEQRQRFHRIAAGGGGGSAFGPFEFRGCFAIRN